MSEGEGATSVLDAIAGMPPRGKEPNSARTLDLWIAAAEREAGLRPDGRLGWLIATTLAVAKLQQATDDSGALFLLKGGTLLQYRLGLSARATKDLDGLVRGNIDGYLSRLDMALGESWGSVEFSRGDAVEFEVPAKLVNPRRFDLNLSIRGKTWRKVQVELSPDEGMSGASAQGFPAPPLDHFGLPTPGELAGISLAYQVAEKYHACTDPHEPPLRRNDRARDVVDLMLLKGLVEETGAPSADELRAAIEDVFSVRAFDAEALGLEPRRLPAAIVAYPHWPGDYEKAAKSASFGVPMNEAIGVLNRWLGGIVDPDS